MPLNVPNSAAKVVTMVNRALNNTAPSNSEFFTQIGTAGNTEASQIAYARAQASALDSLTDAAFAARVLGNFGVLPNADLLDALTVVLGLNPKADRGVIVLNLGNILSGLEGATGEQAIYAPQALAWNNEVNQSFQYSSNTANTNPFVGEFPPVEPPPVFAITPGAASVNEGGSVTFQVTGGQANFTYAYNLGGVSATDVTGPLSGTVTTDATGKGTITVALANDRTTEGAETLTVTLPNTGLSTSVTVNDTSKDNVAPVAEAATGTTIKGGAVVTGQVVAADTEDDALTFALTAPVEGFTLNADGSYSFDPALNTAAQALTYKSAPLPVVANYTVTDALGATATSTITITVTPKPLTFTLVPSAAYVEEGQTISYKLVASEAVQEAVTGSIQVVPGDGSAGKTGANDFGSGALNPQNVTIAVGATESTPFNLIPQNDAATEVPESYTVKATVTGYTIADVTGQVRDPSTVGGVGQTFTLTTGLDTLPGLIGSAGSTGTDGNDTIVATNTTLTTLDSIDAGLGTNVMNYADLAGGVNLDGIGGVTITNVQTINVRSAAAATHDLTLAAGITGVTALNSTQSTTATLKAAATTDIGVSGATGKITTNGGKNVKVNDATADVAIDIGQATAGKGTVTVTDTKQGTGAIKIDGGTDVTATLGGVTTGTLDIGQLLGTAADPTGAVVVNSSGAAYTAATAATTLGAIKIDGGKTISVTQKASSDTTAAAADTTATTITQSAVTIKAGTTTTDVTVKQDAAVTQANAANTTGGVTTSDSVKFAALAAGGTVTLGGLSFTNTSLTATLTGAEVAAAFANLAQNAVVAAPATIAAGDTQGGGSAAKGTYSGLLTGWTSGAASGDTVVFTSTNTNAVQASVGVTGAAFTVTNVTTGKAHDATAVGGKMGIVAGVTDITGGAALKTVTVDGYAATSQVQGAANNALDTVTLANGAGFTVASAAATLALNLTNVNGTVDVQAGTTTLNATVNGSVSSALKSATAKTVNVSGAGIVSGTTTGDLAAATAISTVGMTAGQSTFTLDSTATTFAGGAGADSVTFSNATAATKALDLGAGNDTLTFTGTALPTVVLKGGAGDDTLSLLAANAVTLSGSTAFAAQLDSFERLTVTGATGAQAIDLAQLGFTNYVSVAGVGGAGTLTLNNLANNGTVVLTADVANGVTAAIKDAATGTADVLNVQLLKTTALTGGTLTAANVETVNITSIDALVPTADTHTLTLTADKATSVNVTGNAGLTLTLNGSTKVTSIDGSAMTGNLTVTSLNTTAATTIKGGSGADVLQAAAGSTADVLLGGAGNDVLVGNKGLSTLTGGAGNDVFVLNVASLDVNSYTTIIDFTAGDLLEVTGATKFLSAKVTLGGTAVFQDFANAAINSLAATEAGWFQYGGDTYVVADMGANSTTGFDNGTDFVIKLTGLVDLTNASFNTTEQTISL